MMPKVVDYRGDVTLFLDDETTAIGFVYNYNPKDHTVLYFKKVSEKESSDEKIDGSKIKKISFTGSDEAFGKSWDDWMAKDKREREKLASKLEQEAETRGHL